MDVIWWLSILLVVFVLIAVIIYIWQQSKLLVTQVDSLKTMEEQTQYDVDKLNSKMNQMMNRDVKLANNQTDILFELDSLEKHIQRVNDYSQHVEQELIQLQSAIQEKRNKNPHGIIMYEQIQDYMRQKKEQIDSLETSQKFLSKVLDELQRKSVDMAIVMQETKSDLGTLIMETRSRLDQSIESIENLRTKVQNEIQQLTSSMNAYHAETESKITNLQSEMKRNKIDIENLMSDMNAELNTSIARLDLVTTASNNNLYAAQVNLATKVEGYQEDTKNRFALLETSMSNNLYDIYQRIDNDVFRFGSSNHVTQLSSGSKHLVIRAPDATLLTIGNNSINAERLCLGDVCIDKQGLSNLVNRLNPNLQDSQLFSSTVGSLEAINNQILLPKPTNVVIFDELFQTGKRKDYIIGEYNISNVKSKSFFIPANISVDFYRVGNTTNLPDLTVIGEQQDNIPENMRNNIAKIVITGINEQTTSALNAFINDSLFFPSII